MPDLIRFSDLKNSQPLTLDGANDLFAIAVKNESSETGYTSMTVKPNMIAGYVAEDATYANLKTGSTDGDNTLVKAINKTLSNFADEFNTTAGSTYAKDDCVLYNGVLYQCSNASGTTSGTFIPADWTQVRAVDVGSGGGTPWVDVTGTLLAGNTSITLSDASITTDSTIDYYTNVFGVNPTNVSVVNGSVTLTFDSQASDLGVKVRIT